MVVPLLDVLTGKGIKRVTIAASFLALLGTGFLELGDAHASWNDLWCVAQAVGFGVAFTRIEVIYILVLPGDEICAMSRGVMSRSRRRYTRSHSYVECGLPRVPCRVTSKSLQLPFFGHCAELDVGGVHAYLNVRFILSCALYSVQHYMEKFPGKSLQLSIGQLISVAGLTGIWCAYSAGGHLPDFRCVMFHSLALLRMRQTQHYVGMCYSKAGVFRERNSHSLP